jgi:hypothetical protein
MSSIRDLDGWKAYAVLALACVGAAFAVELVLLRTTVGRAVEPLLRAQRALSAQRTRTTWGIAVGEATIETPRETDGETVREWIERHAATVDEAQTVPSMSPWRPRPDPGEDR